MQLGDIGLIKAIDTFDASYGVMFSTYAVPMIAGEIRRFLKRRRQDKDKQAAKAGRKAFKADRRRIFTEARAKPEDKRAGSWPWGAAQTIYQKCSKPVRP